MSLFQIYKMELYKMSRRKSSYILFIPAILAVLISIGMKSGFVQMNSNGRGSASALSCMDYTMLIFDMMSGLGIIGILFILTAAFQLSGEIEKGQIKIMLLRIGKRSRVIVGKYMAEVTTIVLSIIILVAVVMCSYYLFVSNSKVGNGIFSTTINGITDTTVLMAILYRTLDYIILAAVAYLAGIFLSPFITFVLSMIFMFAEKYLCSINSFKLMKYTPCYMSSKILSGEKFTNAHMAAFVACTVLLICGIIGITEIAFKRQDIK